MTSLLDTTYKAISNVRAKGYVITHPKRAGCATIEIVFPRDGAGR